MHDWNGADFCSACGASQEDYAEFVVPCLPNNPGAAFSLKREREIEALENHLFKFLPQPDQESK